MAKESMSSGGVEIQADIVLGKRHRRGRKARILARDFRRPAPPTGAMSVELQRLGGRFADRMRDTLTAYLRVEVEAPGEMVEVLPYGEAIRPFDDECWFVPLRTSGGRHAVLILDEELQLFLLDRLLGFHKSEPSEDAQEEEDAEEQPEEQTDPSTSPATTTGPEGLVTRIGPISRAALRPFVGSILRRINRLFQGAESSEALVVDKERAALAAYRLMRGGDNVVRFVVALAEKGTGGRLACLMPEGSVLSLVDLDEDRSPSPVAPVVRSHLETVVRRLKMNVTARLGQAPVSLEQFSRLAVGDVLILDRRVGTPLDILVGSEPQFIGLPGLSGARLAVRLIGNNDHKELS